MNLLKKTQYLLLVTAIFAFISCNESNAGSNKSTEVKSANTESQDQSGSQVEETSQKTATGSSKVQTELDKAKKAKKAVFVVITAKDVTNLDKAQQIAKGAAKIYSNSSIVMLNRDDASNAVLVKDWGLAGIPVPFIVVVSPLGIPSGGLPVADATAESISALVPSSKLDQVYQGVNSGKNVIILFTKSTFTDKAQAQLNCREAVKLLNNEAVFVEVDMKDQKEFKFMSDFKIDRENAKQSVTLVINKSGQIAGTYTTTPVTSKLVASAKTPVKKACCPSGSSAGCGPKK